jgi:hypothetical protein
VITGVVVAVSVVMVVVVVVSVLSVVSASLLHATRVPAIAKTAKTFFICCFVLKFE